jgi:transposase
MMKKPVTTKAPAEQVVKDIRRATRKLHSSEEKIRIVLSGLRGEDSIAELCRKEGIAQSLYYSWSKEFLEAGKKRLAAHAPTLKLNHSLGADQSARLPTSSSA